jgi:hypothetical protein
VYNVYGVDKQLSKEQKIQQLLDKLQHRKQADRCIRINLLGTAPPPPKKPSTLGKMWSAMGFIASAMWRWDVVGAGFVLLYGSGVGAMYGHQYVIAVCLYFIAVSWITAKTLTWEEAKKHHARGSVAALVLFGGVAIFGISMVWMLHTYKQEKPRPQPMPLQPQKTPDQQKPQPPTTPIPTPKEPPIRPRKEVQPVKNPLEIVAFFSNYRIEIYNKGPLTAHVLSLVVETKTPGESKSFGLDLDIGAGQTAEAQTHDSPPFPNYRTTKKLGNTWQEHFNKVQELYGKCGTSLVFFSPSDPSFQQVKDHYLKEQEELGYDDISGTLYYRLQGVDETKAQMVPIAVLTIVNNACP